MRVFGRVGDPQPPAFHTDPDFWAAT